MTPGEYLVEGPVDPQVLATVTAWCARSMCWPPTCGSSNAASRMCSSISPAGRCGHDGSELSPLFAAGHLHPRSAPERGAADAGRTVQPGAEAAAAQRRATAVDHVHPDHAAGRTDAAAAGFLRPEPLRDVRPGDHGPGGDLDRVHRAGDRGGVRPPLRRAQTTRRDPAAGLGNHRRQVTGGDRRRVSAGNHPGRHRLCARLATRSGRPRCWAP